MVKLALDHVEAGAVQQRGGHSVGRREQAPSISSQRSHLNVDLLADVAEFTLR